VGNSHNYNRTPSRKVGIDEYKDIFRIEIIWKDNEKQMTWATILKNRVQSWGTGIKSSSTTMWDPDFCGVNKTGTR